MFIIHRGKKLCGKALKKLNIYILIALTQKTHLNQVLAILCQIDDFNGADFFVHPCVIFYDSLHANFM